MKLLNKRMLFVFFTIIASTSFAQTKQKLFASYPETISLNKEIITEAFSKNEGVTFSLTLSSDFIFEGTVISNQQKYNNLQTIIVRSNSNSESILQFSKIINNDKSVSFAGILINQNAADGYTIKNNNGIYTLQKFETDKILEPCKL